MRQRKTKAPCQGCFLNPALCICALAPSLDLRTRVALVVHAKELKRTTNTGRLAVSVLRNSDMRIRGNDKERVDLSDWLTPNYRSVLFYPSADAVELTQEFVAQDPRPIQLIVPDGNWRQAGKVHTRHPELKDLPRVKISRPNQLKDHLRAEHNEYGMSTMHAIAEALRITEGESAYESLMAFFRAKLENTLIGRRGALSSALC